MSQFSISRRAVLTGAAALPLTAAPLAATAQSDTARSAGQAPVLARRLKLGDATVTTLLDASFPRDGAQEIFGGNVTAEEFGRVSAENFIPADMAQFYFTPSLVETAGGRVLFDTGLGKGGIGAALAQAGVAPADIDVVVITHMHPDHIGGLMTDGAPTFTNARYVTGQAEYDFWSSMDPGNRVGDLVASNMTPLAEKTTFARPGDQIAPGITAVDAHGHTPGHMGYMLDMGGQQLLLAGDMANHYVWSFAHPDWHVKFDMDKDAASASRRRIMSMLAADRVPMIGYHMPFPAVGFVEARGDGFRFVPVSYQMMG